MSTQFGPVTDAALRETAKRLDEPGAVVFCGFPGAGKSTAARYLASLSGAVILDKDRFAPEVEESVMGVLTHPHDRDSDVYKSVVAPHIYTGLIRTGLRVAAKCPVVLDAPFLSTIQQASNHGTSLRERLCAIADLDEPVPVTTIWIDSAHADIRTRMHDRGFERDAGKLADWDAYRTGVLDSGLRELACSVVDLVIAN
ncbi:AAA family ATPase [Nocardia miyunensis]|uniref:AAA family ATPase n=1 Tax=Nocardia miyunensis TaxID=282684 RepID=UPI001470BC0F|nr:AAA family ATPase [Nocardia miyunensis]